MLNEKYLLQSTIAKICSYYSRNENVNGILKVENINEIGIKKMA